MLDCSQRLKDAYFLKEEFREIDETHQTPEEAEILLQAWMKKAAKFYNDSIKTIKNHLQGICHYFYELYGYRSQGIGKGSLCGSNPI